VTTQAARPTVLRTARDGDRAAADRAGLAPRLGYVDDVVEACVRAREADDLPSGTVLNVGNGRRVRTRAVAAQSWRPDAPPHEVGAHPGRWDTGSGVSDPSMAAGWLGLGGGG
jgi:nucleoside-diphosphate-sugar epimerase